MSISKIFADNLIFVTQKCSRNVQKKDKVNIWYYLEEAIYAKKSNSSQTFYAL